MAALRLAATMAHCLPGVRLRVRDGDRTLLTVARPPFDEDGPVVGPCVFRRVVGRAHEQLKAGTCLSFMGLAADVDPAVDAGVRPGDAVLPGGIHRVRVGDGIVHAFATTLPARHCRSVLDRGHWGDVHLHGDVATEVTLVHTVTHDGATTSAPASLEELLAALVADEVVHALGVS
ncbi:MAG: hypothetical protein KY443_07370 [Actinobacteria bacterium]|nr:hypothetical protein [Actinomycetota bacterium]